MIAPAAETAREPARIVDETAANTEPTDPGLQQNPLSRIQSPLADSSTTDSQDTLATAEGNGSAAPSSAPRRSTPARTGSRTTTASSNSSGNDLLSTLLGIIRQEDEQPAASPMDELISQVLAENERNYNETSAALASLGQPQAEQSNARAARPSRAQRALQSCPAANTVQGINCRDRVCARWAGRDPACPAR
ncbi:MAG TPA: hypothetical protein H9827_08805 [Candidatus Luteimonas excrementigallinarum]|nr:hypothetical protein [Candidatus Luteimonas excrementigallinarum]